MKKPLRVYAKRQVPKSAPPVRTTSRHITHKTHSKDAFSISLDDIYQSAERERLSYSAICRRQNLEHAQSQTQFFRHENNTITTSRPNTSASYFINRRDISTPLSAWSEPLISRPSSLIRHSGLNDLEEDEEDFDEYGMDHNAAVSVTVSPVSKDCCEIIGPQMCQECRKTRIRELEKERSSQFFPTLQPSEENLTTTAIVKKYLPGLSYPEIEDKIARGEIAKPSFRRRSKSVEFSDEEEDPKQKMISTKKVTIIENDDDKRQQEITRKPSALFFSDIRDLNNKIITGSVDRNIGFTISSAKKSDKKKLLSAAQNYFPTFISPRKVSATKDVKFKTFYEPPLIPKASQDVEPAFFAGSKGEYTPPERLPEELVFVDKEGKLVKISNTGRLSAQLSIYTESPIAEEQSEDVIETGKVSNPSPGIIQEETVVGTDLNSSITDTGNAPDKKG